MTNKKVYILTLSNLEFEGEYPRFEVGRVFTSPYAAIRAVEAADPGPVDFDALSGDYWWAYSHSAPILYEIHGKPVEGEWECHTSAL